VKIDPFLGKIRPLNTFDRPDDLINRPDDLFKLCTMSAQGLRTLWLLWRWKMQWKWTRFVDFNSRSKPAFCWTLSDNSIFL